MQLTIFLYICIGDREVMIEAILPIDFLNLFLMNKLYDLRHTYSGLDELEFVFEKYACGIFRYSAETYSDKSEFALEVLPLRHTINPNMVVDIAVLTDNEDLETISKQVSKFRLTGVFNGEDVDTDWVSL